MVILSHRGLWKTKAEHNTEPAFRTSFELGFGTETDLRWAQNHINISHDLVDEHAIEFKTVLREMGDRNLPLALNIKCDGLATHIAEAMRAAHHTNYFVFDMSIPDMRSQFSAGNPVYTRMSDIEKEPVLLSDAAGVWLDAFHSDWFTEREIESLVSKGKKVCIVSPELHKRDKTTVWEMLRSLPAELSANLQICTDLPQEAKIFFGAQT